MGHYFPQFLIVVPVEVTSSQYNDPLGQQQSLGPLHFPGRQTKGGVHSLQSGHIHD